MRRLSRFVLEVIKFKIQTVHPWLIRVLSLSNASSGENVSAPIVSAFFAVGFACGFPDLELL